MRWSLSSMDFCTTYISMFGFVLICLLLDMKCTETPFVYVICLKLKYIDLNAYFEQFRKLIYEFTIIQQWLLL